VQRTTTITSMSEINDQAHEYSGRGILIVPRGLLRQWHQMENQMDNALVREFFVYMTCLG